MNLMPPESLIANAQVNKFYQQIQQHFNYLTEAKTLMPPKQWQEQRSRILQTMNYYIYDALLQKVILYDEYKYIRQVLIDALSWENLIGYKQLSLFDDPSFEVQQKPNLQQYE